MPGLRGNVGLQPDREHKAQPGHCRELSTRARRLRTSGQNWSVQLGVTLLCQTLQSPWLCQPGDRVSTSVTTGCLLQLSLLSVFPSACYARGKPKGWTASPGPPGHHLAGLGHPPPPLPASFHHPSVAVATAIERSFGWDRVKLILVVNLMQSEK